MKIERENIGPHTMSLYSNYYLLNIKTIILDIDEIKYEKKNIIGKIDICIYQNRNFKSIFRIIFFFGNNVLVSMSEISIFVLIYHVRHINDQFAYGNVFGSIIEAKILNLELLN